MMNDDNFVYCTADQIANPISFPLISHRGKGGFTDPFRATLLLRHADFADESTPDNARTIALQILEVLDESVSRISVDAELSTESAKVELEVALKIASEIAQSDTYYSVLVVVLCDKRLVAAGIGHVNLWRWHKGIFESLIQPTVVHQSSDFPKRFLLTSALGIGFNPEMIQSCDVRLENKDCAILAVQARQSLSNENLGYEEQSASEWLDKLVSWFQIRPSLLAVVSATVRNMRKS
jgi:hypothetical protein